MSNENIIEYYSLNSYLKNTYGYKLYKVPINGGFTCPNRDGSKDTRGCIFCSKYGSGDFIQSKQLSITQQINDGIDFISAKFKINDKKGRYIAYFQAYTNTYSSIDDLKQKYYEAVSNENIGIVSIATRPDCLDDEVLKLIEEINEIKPVWVELGLQSTKQETIDYIRRCYENIEYDNAIKNLYSINISQIITHIILGLPYETEDDMVNTTLYVSDLIKNNCYNPSRFGYKFQLLHVLKGTDLEKEYLDGKFNTLSSDEYIDILKKCLSVISQESVVHRLTGDGDKKLLISPLWSGNKKKVLNDINKSIKKR